MSETNQAPATCDDRGKLKDWRPLVDPLMVEMLDRLFPFVKGSLRFEIAPDDKPEGENNDNLS